MFFDGFNHVLAARGEIAAVPTYELPERCAIDQD